jgi:hypothetical protein
VEAVVKNMLLQLSAKRLALFGLAVVAAATVAPEAHALSVKADQLAIRGCISKVSVRQATEIVERYNYELIGATILETRSVGTTLTWIERLNGGKPFQYAIPREGYGVRFREKKGNSAQKLGEIAINRNGALNYGENIAQLAHEIGHLVGNNGLYAQYREAIGHTKRHPKFCRVSGYSDDKANEQFAEVFAAFVTRPELIRDNKSDTCKKAYAFFKKVFANGGLADKCYDAQNVVEQKLKNGGVLPPTPPDSPQPEGRHMFLQEFKIPLLLAAPGTPRSQIAGSQPSPYWLLQKPKPQPAKRSLLLRPGSTLYTWPTAKK